MIVITFDIWLCAMKWHLFLKMQFSFQILINIPVLTDVPVLQLMLTSVEDVISQCTSESRTLKTL